MPTEAKKNENIRSWKNSQTAEYEDDEKDIEDDDGIPDFMNMPQVCKELQREPTGTITPIDTQREEESRLIDALSNSVCSQHAALYWPWGDSPLHLSKFTRKTPMQSP